MPIAKTLAAARDHVPLCDLAHTSYFILPSPLPPLTYALQYQPCTAHAIMAISVPNTGGYSAVYNQPKVQSSMGVCGVAY